MFRRLELAGSCRSKQSVLSVLLIWSDEADETDEDCCCAFSWELGDRELVMMVEPVELV